MLFKTCKQWIDHSIKYERQGHLSTYIFNNAKPSICKTQLYNGRKTASSLPAKKCNHGIIKSAGVLSAVVAFTY